MEPCYRISCGTLLESNGLHKKYQNRPNVFNNSLNSGLLWLRHSAQKHVSAWCKPNLFHNLYRDVILLRLQVILLPFYIVNHLDIFEQNFEFWPSVGWVAGWPALQSAQKRVSAWCELNLFHSLSRDVIFCSPLVPFFLLQLKHEPNSHL